MVLFQCLSIPTEILKRLNRVRIYLQVFDMSDITSVDGKCICREDRFGFKNYESAWNWPQSQPSDTDMAMWKFYMIKILLHIIVWNIH